MSNSASVITHVLIREQFDIMRRSIDRLKKFGESKEDYNVVDSADHLKTELNYLRQYVETYSKPR